MEREATQFLHSATLALGVCMHIASVADPQLWSLIHLLQPHIRSPHIMQVHWIYEISEDKCEHMLFKSSLKDHIPPNRCQIGSIGVVAIITSPLPALMAGSCIYYP